VSKRRIIYF